MVRQKPLFQIRYCESYSTGCIHEGPAGCTFPRPRTPAHLDQLRQTRIDEAFGGHRAEKKSIYSLPSSIRRQIYINGGLPHNQKLQFHTDFRMGCISDWVLDDRENDYYHIIMDFLQISRLVRDEVITIFFSENHFVVPLSTFRPERFQYLRDLSTRAVSLMTRLTLYVMFESCHHEDSCKHSYGRLQSPPILLDCCSRTNVDIYREWECTARYLASLVMPSKLDLRICLKTETLSATKLCLEPLSYMPELKKFTIGLSKAASSEALMLARATASRLGQRGLKPSSFYYFQRLPQELQLEILEYTDLITPFHEVEYEALGKYDLNGRYVMRFGLLCCYEDHRYQSVCPPSLHHACRYRPFGEFRDFHYPLVNGNNFTILQGHCWMPPTPMFLVSTTMRQLAQQVFFTGNRFVFPPSNRPYPRASACDLIRFPVATYLRRAIPRDAVQWLRQVEVLLPVFVQHHCEPMDIAFEEWLDAIRSVQNLLRVSQLTITLHVADRGLTSEPRNPSRAAMDYMATQYKRFLSTLSRLNGLKGFYVHIHSQYPWMPELNDDSYEQERRGRHSEQSKDRAQLISQDMEQCVMGRSYVSGDAKEKYFREPQCLIGDVYRYDEIWHTY